MEMKKILYNHQWLKVYQSSANYNNIYIVEYQKEIRVYNTKTKKLEPKGKSIYGHIDKLTPFSS